MFCFCKKKKATIVKYPEPMSADRVEKVFAEQGRDSMLFRTQKMMSLNSLMRLAEWMPYLELNHELKNIKNEYRQI
jgi:hypothetical protein